MPSPALSLWLSPRRVLLLFAFWLIATAGLRPLLLPDEGRYATVARDMLWGDALTPLLNGLPFFHKPPLMYWLDMAAMSVLGVNQLSARFAPFVGAWLMGAALFLTLRRWHGPHVALAALLVLATTPFFYVGSQYANLDMLVAGLITATLLAMVRALEDARPALRWLLLGWAFAALSVLAKGLIGIVLPALVIGPWLLLQGRWRDLLRLLHPAALLLFAVIALPWFVMMQQRYPGFFDYFVMEQHFRRFAQANFNNVHPAWFYVAVLPLLTLPWSGWLPWAVRRNWQLLHGDERMRVLLLVWWIVVVVGFFSLPSSKLVGYVLPALAPWCLLLADAARQRPRAMAATLLAAGLVSVGAVLLLVEKTPRSSKSVATELAARFVSGDRVVFVDEMFYDLPFYAGLKQPVVIASTWDDPELPKHDNWRKELADAARFDPVKARALLWPIARLPELACHSQAVWFVAPTGRPRNHPPVPGLIGVYADPHVVLMRASGRC